MAKVYSNRIYVSAFPGLMINNYKVEYSCNAMEIVASGVVTYNNNPVPNIRVDVGFCSYFDFNTNQFRANFTTTTQSDGSFMIYIYTATPPGGGNCIVAMVQYNGQTAVAHQSITIPQC